MSYRATIQKCSYMDAPIAAQHRQYVHAAHNGDGNEADLIVLLVRLVDERQANRIEYHEWPNDCPQRHWQQPVQRYIAHEIVNGPLLPKAVGHFARPDVGANRTLHKSNSSRALAQNAQSFGGGRVENERVRWLSGNANAADRAHDTKCRNENGHQSSILRVRL